MSSKKLRFGLFSLLTLFALGTHAQMGKLFDADKQMSSSYTTQVYLDRDGFIWVATRNGLNRYDGYQFRILKKEIRQDIGMVSNYVNCMMQDRNGLFYIGMYGAFQTYDGERFHDVKTCDLDNRVVPCYVTCLLDCPWVYPLVEITVFQAMYMYTRSKHEALCAQLSNSK